MLSAHLAGATIAFYVLVYTLLLKRRTSQNVVWGGAAGCMPVMIGWSAVTGTIAWPALVMFAIIFFWTPPHTWALAMRYKDDYAAAGVPMLPVVATERAGHQADPDLHLADRGRDAGAGAGDRLAVRVRRAGGGHVVPGDGPSAVCRRAPRRADQAAAAVPAVEQLPGRSCSARWPSTRRWTCRRCCTRLRVRAQLARVTRTTSSAPKATCTSATSCSDGGFGKFFHFRELSPIDHQLVIRANRDTLYSAAVFDLDAGPVDGHAARRRQAGSCRCRSSTKTTTPTRSSTRGHAHASRGSRSEPATSPRRCASWSTPTTRPTCPRCTPAGRHRGRAGRRRQFEVPEWDPVEPEDGSRRIGRPWPPRCPTPSGTFGSKARHRSRAAPDRVRQRLGRQPARRTRST